MISNKDVFSCISKGLKILIKKIQINSSDKDFQEWHSLSHFNILNWIL